MSITFIIPTINEEENVNAVIDAILVLTNRLNLSYEILFVDDQSTDGTVTMVMKRAQANARIRLLGLPERKGLGFALWQGMRCATMEYILFLDCDLSVSEYDLERLIVARAPETMVIGSRYMRQSRIVNAPAFKVFLSRMLNFMVSLISGVKIRDMSHSLRVFKNDKQFVPAAYTHPAFFWELSAYMHMQGIIVQEIPVTFVERRLGLTKNRMMSMVRSVRMGLLTVLRYRFKGRTI